MMRFTMRILLALCAASLACAAVAAPAPLVTAPQVDTPTRVLFVGNSYFYYNDSLHNHVRRMATAADPRLEKTLHYKSATIGGARLDEHDIDWLTKPGQIGVKEPFQLVILQGASSEPLSEEGRARFRATGVRLGRRIAEGGGKDAHCMTHD